MATILVVDDSPVDRNLVGGLLKMAPSAPTVRFACNGREAMEFIRHEVPQLVVTDLMMPEMDGLDLVADIVKTHASVPVVLMTGAGSEEIAVQALRAGAASYVPKSALADMLVETIENLLELSREEQRQTDLMSCMTRCSCDFVLGNDSRMIPPLVSFLHHSVRNIGLCDEVSSIRVSVALEEALNNALFHGNLELDSELRETDIDAYRSLMDQRVASPPYSERQIHVTIDVSRDDGCFTIRDQGPGFDPAGLPDPTDPANLEKPSGRGLLLMRTFMDEVKFNEVGNEVTLVKRTQPVELAK